MPRISPTASPDTSPVQGKRGHSRFTLNPGTTGFYILVTIAMVNAGAFFAWTTQVSSDKNYTLVHPLDERVTGPTSVSPDERVLPSERMSPDEDVVGPTAEQASAQQEAEIPAKTDTTHITKSETKTGTIETKTAAPNQDRNAGSRPDNNIAFASFRTPGDIVPASMLAADSVALSPRPLPELIETADSLSLPIISDSGKQPWIEYAGPANLDDGQPRLAIIIDGMGLDEAHTRDIIETLPGSVTLAFSPYGEMLEPLVGRAREKGHEILLSVPMETANTNINDPGPYALMRAASPEKNLANLAWAMNRFSTYVGIIPMMRNFFVTSRTAMEPVLNDLKKRGLLFVSLPSYQRTPIGRLARATGVPTVNVDIVLDMIPSREAIDRQIEHAEALARHRGYATVRASPHPLSLERIALWLTRLDGVKNVPLTAIIRHPPAS